MLKAAVINDIRGATTLSVLGGVVVPVFIAFILFSTPRSRHRPIFWIQSTALLMAMTQAAVEISSYHIDIETNGLHPQLFFNLCAARESLKWLIPWITDCALLFKLLCFYPKSVCSRKKQLGMISFPAIIKIPRLTVITINLVIMCRAFASQQTTWPGGEKYQVAEVAMQIADNSYCSAILLYKSWTFYHATSGLVSRTARGQRRARHILESVVMSFVPAICIQIAFLVVQVIPGDNANELAEAQNYLFLFNVYFSLLFSILATSWSCICNIAQANRKPVLRPLHLSSARSGLRGSSNPSESQERDLPEHRTLLQYLTTSEEVEQVSPELHPADFSPSLYSEQNNNKLDLEKGEEESRESLQHTLNTAFFPRRKASDSSHSANVMTRQETHRSDSSQTSPEGSSRGHSFRSSTADKSSRVSSYRSPHLPPFEFQDSASNDSTLEEIQDVPISKNALL